MKIQDEVVTDGYPVVSYHYKNFPTCIPKHKQLRHALLILHTSCYWCKKPIKDYPHIEGEHPQHDLATIDHIDGKSIRTKGVISPKVLACFECNNRRSVKQNPKHRPYEVS